MTTRGGVEIFMVVVITKHVMKIFVTSRGEIGIRIFVVVVVMTNMIRKFEG